MSTAMSRASAVVSPLVSSLFTTNTSVHLQRTVEQQHAMHIAKMQSEVSELHEQN
jgi:hypothetical protein